ncbi:MAG: WxcM-like domain-containing protein [Bacteroidaceae bacterium]|nr:WxcM-like domain-containing protein [Bacteroidaceae bacterium]
MADEKVTLIQGEVFTDHRGRITSLNAFRFPGVERVYFIHHSNADVVRGWHGHQFERKWFYCVKGSFRMGFVRPDNWEHPSADLEPEFFELDEHNSQIVCVPPGYANCLKAHQPGSVLMVLSGATYPECLADSWRYPTSMWWRDE